jgi:hypothetical protein
MRVHPFSASGIARTVFTLPIVLLVTCSGQADAPRPSAAAPLQRPLHLAEAATGDCIPSEGRVASSLSPVFGSGFALSDGPVYPIIDDGQQRTFDTAGLIKMPQRGTGRPPVVKILWIADPSYRGPVLVRGERLVDSTPLHFRHGAVDGNGTVLSFPAAEASSSTSRWRTWPTSVDILSTGCYGFQIDGTGLSDVVVIREER